MARSAFAIGILIAVLWDSHSRAAAESLDPVRASRALLVNSMPEDGIRIEKLLVDAIRIEPHDAEAHALLSRFIVWQVAQSLRDPSDLHFASQLAQQARELAENRPLGAYALAEILFALGQSAAADAIASEAVASYPTHADTYAFMTRHYASTEPARALAAAQQALAAGHPMDDLSTAIATAIRALSPGEDLGAALERFATVYPDRWIMHRAGMAYSANAKPAAAKAALRAAVRLGNAVESNLQLAILEYGDGSDPKSAVARLRVVARSLGDGENVRPEARALVHAHLALACLAARDEECAADEVSVALNAGHWNPQLSAGMVEEFRKRKAEPLLQKGLQRSVVANPQFAYGHLILAGLAVKRSDHPAAVRSFSAALALLPERDELFSQRAHEYYRMKKWEMALADFDDAIRLKPGLGTHHYNRACMLALLGRKDEAISSIRAAVLLDRSLRTTALADADLQSLRGESAFDKELVTPSGVLSERDTNEH